MLKKDNLFVGIVTGIVFPAIFYFLLKEINSLLQGSLLPDGEGLSDRLIAIIALCSNLLPFLAYNYSRKAKSMRGILGATIALAFVIIIVYYDTFIE